MTTLMALAICCRMAFSGRSRLAMAIMVSSRLSASRGVLAWSVVSEPSWPVFMACSMSTASAPRTLAHDDAVGPHTQRVDQQQPLGHLARALDVGRAGLQPDHVGLAELELGRVLDRDDPLGGRDERRQDVEQRRLAGAGAARDEDVEPGLDDRRCSSSSIGSVGAVVAQQVLGRTARPAGTYGSRGGGRRCASGLMIAFTREPSGRRASTIGERVVDPAAHRPRRSGR